MNTTITKIKNTLSSKIFLLILTSIFAFLFIKSCGHNPDTDLKLKMAQQNLDAVHDSIKLEKQKSGNLSASITSYVASEKDLKNINSDLYNKINEQKGQIVSLGNVVFKLKQDSITLHKFLNASKSINGVAISLGNNTYDLPWTLRYDYDDKNYDVLAGNTKVGLIEDSIHPVKHIGTELTNRESQIDLTFGQKVENGKLRVFAESKYPGFTPESLSGVLIDPNDNPYIKSLISKKKWFPNTWSIGISTTFGYDLLHGNGTFVIGPSFTYNIYEW
jgi:hypothetical protein